MSHFLANLYTSKSVVITGGASGIGYAMAREFGLRGANVMPAVVVTDPRRGVPCFTHAAYPTGADLAVDGGSSLPVPTGEPPYGAGDHPTGPLLKASAATV